MLVVCETWLNDRVDDNEIAISGYTIYCKDRYIKLKMVEEGVFFFMFITPCHHVTAWS